MNSGKVTPAHGPTPPNHEDPKVPRQKQPRGVQWTLGPPTPRRDRTQTPNIPRRREPSVCGRGGSDPQSMVSGAPHSSDPRPESASARPRGPTPRPQTDAQHPAQSHRVRALHIGQVRSRDAPPNSPHPGPKPPVTPHERSRQRPGPTIPTHDTRPQTTYASQLPRPP